MYMRLLYSTKFFFSFFVLFTINVNAQFQFNYQDSIDVIKAGVELKMPWAGGLNYAQFSEIDVDFDSDMDLFVFDRSANQVKVFLNEQGGSGSYYKFSPQHSNLFPQELRYRSFLIDYNNDGRNDLFTYGIGGIKVYKNTGDIVNGLQWDLAKELLYSNYWGQMLNLYVSSSDIPAIVDVDNDGDIDVLTYHIGGEHLQYHKNMSMELYNNVDSLVFELKNECWGGFREDFSTNNVYLNDSSSICISSNVPNPEITKPGVSFEMENPSKMHAGSTVLALDIDGSGVKDLVLGDVSYSNLTLLINGGSSPNTNSLMISSDASFPSNSTPVNLYLFPAAFNVDVNFDNIKDLIVCPNAKNVSNNEKSVHKYLNTGSNNSSNFVFNTDAFLQEEMIEHGSGSIPHLMDMNNDGLLDLFVSNFYAYKDLAQKESRIAFYQNTGTNLVPQFTLIDDDFLNLSQQSLGLRIVPSFGDINGDNLPDIILGLENGSIAYLENITTGSNISFASPLLNYTDNTGVIISVGQYAAPQLFDLNQDGLLDLVIGNKTGELIYYENTGSSNVPAFTLANNVLGNVDVETQSINGYAVPCFFDYDNAIYLMVGAYDGKIHFYDQIQGNINQGQSFHNISNEFLGIDVGAFSSPFVSDIDNDGNLNLFLGQDLGGLFHLENDSLSNLSINNNNGNFDQRINIYPNPCLETLNIHVKSKNKGLQAKIINTQGVVVKLIDLKNGNNTINTKSLPSGIYFVYLDSYNTYPTRFVKK